MITLGYRVSLYRKMVSSLEEGQWLVIAVSEKDWVVAERHCLAITAHSEAQGSCSRTLLLKNGARITVVHILDDPDSFEEPFHLYFLGWSSDPLHLEARKRWQKKALSKPGWLENLR